MIDLPKKPARDAVDAPETAFYEELVFFLKASTLHDNIIAKLSNFDFKEASRYRFVHSMYVFLSIDGQPLTCTSGGSHIGEHWRRTGHCGLGRAVSSLGLRTHEPINIDFVVCQIEFLRPD